MYENKGICSYDPAQKQHSVFVRPACLFWVTKCQNDTCASSRNRLIIRLPLFPPNIILSSSYRCAPHNSTYRDVQAHFSLSWQYSSTTGALWLKWRVIMTHWCCFLPESSYFYARFVAKCCISSWRKRFAFFCRCLRADLTSAGTDPQWRMFCWFLLTGNRQ